MPTDAGDAASGRKYMTVWAATVMGIGAMVGAGIFALLAEAGAVAQSATWLSFLLAGAVATSVGYVMLKLGMVYPSSGGMVTYLVEGFGSGPLLGVLMWLTYFGVTVILCAMAALTFGQIAASLFLGAGTGSLWVGAFSAGLVVLLVAVNIVGVAAIGRVQSLIVTLLLVVFAVFIVATLSGVDVGMIAPKTYPPFNDVLAGVGITFYAFLGFGLITFASGSMRRPARDLPKAFWLALGITTLVYVLISIGVFGVLTPDQVGRYGTKAIAEAARPALGDAGFLMMAIAGLLATTSTVNATLFAVSGVMGAAVDAGQTLPIFGRNSPLGPHAGLLITAAITLVFVATVNLSAIADMGSAVSLAVFVLVTIAGLRLRRKTKTPLGVILTAMALTSIAFVSFLVSLAQDEPRTLAVIGGILVLAVVLERVTAWVNRRGAGAPPAASQREAA